MKAIATILTVGLAAVSLSCYSQAGPEPKAEAYQSCCGTQPVEFSFEDKRVFVPNAFTPNGDKVNDYFAPFVNETISDVWGFAIYSAEGDTLLYLREHFFPNTEKVHEHGWNGLRPDGTPYKGLFRYRMRVDDKIARKFIVEGVACAIVCGKEAQVFQSKEGCFYPSQAGKEGTLEKEKASEEKICFQEISNQN